MSARTHAIYDRAASWIVQSEAPDWSEERQAELEMWLGESYGHRAAYLRLLSSWRAADVLAGQEPEIIADDEDEERPAGRSFPFMALAASFLAFAVIGSVLWLLSISATNMRGGQIASGSPASASEQFVTQVGARAIIPLSDGSQIELNTDSAMRVHMGSSRREVWLDRGEAYFEVAHREDVPFVVHAGERNVTVLGTRFAIWREPEKLTVAVAQGRVQLKSETNASLSAPALLSAGTVAIARGGSTLVEVGAWDKVDNLLSWRQGILRFSDARLADVIEQFNRYHMRKIVISGKNASNIRIGGSFRVSDVDPFVQLLRDAYALDVTRSQETIKISEH